MTSNGYVPPVPMSSPEVRFSDPVDPVDIATALMHTTRLGPGHSTAAPPNSVASGSDHGQSIGGSTVFGTPSVPLTERVAAIRAAALSDDPYLCSLGDVPSPCPEAISFAHRLAADPALVKNDDPADDGTSSISGITSHGTPPKSILKQSRSSHATPAEIAAAGLLGLDGRSSANGGSACTLATPGDRVGVVEHSFWNDTVREDLVRVLLRLGQLASDMHGVDDSKPIHQYYDEELSKAMNEAATKLEFTGLAKADADDFDNELELD